MYIYINSRYVFGICLEILQFYAQKEAMFLVIKIHRIFIY